MAALAEQERRVTWAGGLVLRLGHLYGPGSSFAPGGGFTRQLRAARVPLVGDGASMFSFVHAHDVATAILAAVEHPAASGVCNNIVDDQPTMVHDWLPEMAARLGAPAPRPPGPPACSRLAGPDVRRWVGRGLHDRPGRRLHMLARHQLDWKPAYGSWRDGLSADLGLRIAPGNAERLLRL
jgi:nucleoside-diphosphate-sugar epimerase